jgi:hypothetical protein
VKLQANLELALLNIFLGKVKWAGTQGNGLFNKIQELPDFVNRGIWTKILGSVFNFLPGEVNPWKGFVLNDDIRISLIVLQVNIEKWLKLLDKRVFEKKGILLRIDNGKFNLPDAFYQFMCLITT